MLKKIFLLLLVVSSFESFGQRTYWASSVIDFTSELSSYEYSAEQVIGKPDALPQGGDNPNAWMPAKPNKVDFITVRFDREIEVQQILIAESYNPSALSELYLYDDKGVEHLVHQFEPKPIDLKGRLINIFIEKTDYPVSALKLVLDGRTVPGYSGIDAIGISSSRKPVEVEIDLPDNLREKIYVEKLDEKVNSPYEESRPLISPDGRTLYFSRANHPENTGGEDDNNDVWFSEMDEATGGWKEAKNLGEPINNKGPNYISSITPDGNAMTVILGNEYTGRDKMNPGVSISSKTSEGWSEPKPLDITNAYIESVDGNYFLANNRRVLIMAIDRYDAFGGKDLYASFLQNDGRWSEPLNLGNDVNTAHVESSPYLAADNETLYFSSKGYSGYGGSDVYISRRLDDTWTNWTEPENLGSDVNSEGDDMFFTIPPSGKFAFYAKSSEGDKGDIHSIALPIFYQPAPVVSLSGKVLDDATDNPVNAKITYSLLPENVDIGFVHSDSLTGQYEILLPVGSAYDYQIEAEGYEPLSASIDLADQTDFNEMVKDIRLTNEGGKAGTIVAQNPEKQQETAGTTTSDYEDIPLEEVKEVRFEFASDYVEEKYQSALDKVAEHLLAHPLGKVTLTGYTDNTGSAQYNTNLSKRRAQSVADYLAGKGIARARITVQAKGSENPAASNETSDGRQLNRRVEINLE
jgi:outer membrane protein OmpA-like peptidoglycan-associated protein